MKHSREAEVRYSTNDLPCIGHRSDGSTAEARALHDNASSASFVSEWLVQSLSCSFQSNYLSLGSVTQDSNPVYCQFQNLSSQACQKENWHYCCHCPQSNMWLASLSHSIWPEVRVRIWPAFGWPRICTTLMDRHTAWSRCLCQSIAPWPVDRTSRITLCLWNWVRLGP